MPTVLVTGATGFLGGHVVREFGEHGWRVIAAGRRASAVPGGAMPFVGDLEALASADASALLGEPGAGVDVVVHCAALSSPWGRWEDFRAANVDGTRFAYEFARKAGARRFVHVSSPSVYAARRDRLGIREDEVDQGNRLNGYIRSKIEAEAFLARGSATAPGESRPDVVVLRPRGLIGAGDPSLVPRLLQAHSRVGIPLFRGGANLVDLTAVQNVALACRLAAEVPEAAGRTFNITNGDPRPFRDVAEQLLAVRGLAPRFRPLSEPVAYAVASVFEAVCGILPGRPEPPLTRYTVTTLAYAQTLDITHARDVLGYEPIVSLDDALQEYAMTDRPRSADNIQRPGGGVRLRSYACGSTSHDVAQIMRGIPRERRDFPATVFLYTDGDRRVLFDTGYAPPPWPGLKAAIYRRLLPPEIVPGETVDARLRAAGVDPESITHVVLSHLHPDHIGGVRYFPQARFVLGAGAVDALHRSRLSESVLDRLLPDWFRDADLLVVGSPADQSAGRRTAPRGAGGGATPASPSGRERATARTRAARGSTPASTFVDGPHGLHTFDLFGDGSYLIVDLPGHARGHIGALIHGQVLLAGDASWGRDLLGREKDMRLLVRGTSHHAATLAATAQTLLAAEASGVRLLLSHDAGSVGLDLRLGGDPSDGVDHRSHDLSSGVDLP